MESYQQDKEKIYDVDGHIRQIEDLDNDEGNKNFSNKIMKELEK